MSESNGNGRFSRIAEKFFITIAIAMASMMLKLVIDVNGMKDEILRNRGVTCTFAKQLHIVVAGCPAPEVPP